MSWQVHEILGGGKDGQVKHMPCRDDGDTMWMEVSKADYVNLDSEVMLTADTLFRKYVHVTIDGKHYWKEL